MNNRSTILVMGNGPSLKHIDFNKLKDIDTFGLNSAYRAYYRMNWWPTYHGCFDYRVTESHKEEFKKLTLGNNSIKRFFYLQKVSDSERLTKITLNRSSGNFSQGPIWQNSEADFDKFNDGGNSGVNACRVSVCMGYKKIILAGVDCNYQEIIDGASLKKTGTSDFLQMEKTPEVNPNYWFDDYQQKGDIFNVPRTNVFQRPGWETLSRQAKNEGIEIINCSKGTKLTCFPIKDIEEVI